MAPTLYMMALSPPSRAVLMTAKSIGLSLDIKEVDLSKGEQKKPEFLKLNPQHTVPVLVDEDGFLIWDSHAIMPYILSKYSENDSLYPKDPKKRAIIDQRLHFDSGVAWARAVRILVPIYRGAKTIPRENIDSVNEIFSLIETLLEGKKWIAGDSVTIADFSFVTTINTLDMLVQIDGKRFPELTEYMKRGMALPVYAVAKDGHQIFVDLIRSLLD